MTACNDGFLEMAVALGRSVVYNTPYEFRLDILNPEKKGLRDNQLRDYCANYRLEMFKELINPDDDNLEGVIWLDADSIVRADVPELAFFLKNYDTFATKTPEFKSPMNQWLISTVGVANTQSGLRFIQEWDKCYQEIHARMYPSIMTIQLAYVTALEKSKDWVKVQDIGYTYSDKGMRASSPIWEGQGHRKWDDPFQTEMKRYSKRELQ